MKRRTALAGVGRTVAAGASGAVAAGLAGCLGGRCSSQDYEVGMADSAFEPQEVTVSVGDTVRWLNNSGRAHTVTAYGSAIPDGADFFASGGFESTAAARTGWENGEGAIYTCEAFEHTFETAGEFGYFCIPHERAGMVGTVVVEK